MSVETATLLAGGLAILGTLLGAILGLVGDRFLRSRGHLLCRTMRGEIRFLHETGDWGKPLDDPGDPVGISYDFGLDLFNSKETPVGLHDLSIVFVCDGERLVVKPNNDQVGTKLGAHGSIYKPLHSINLPPRQWVHVELIGNSRDVETAKTWRRIEFVGHRGTGGFFEPEEFRKTIKER